MVAIVANSGARLPLMIFVLPLVFGIGKSCLSFVWWSSVFNFIFRHTDFYYILVYITSHHSTYQPRIRVLREKGSHPAGIDGRSWYGSIPAPLHDPLWLVCHIPVPKNIQPYRSLSLPRIL